MLQHPLSLLEVAMLLPQLTEHLPIHLHHIYHLKTNTTTLTQHERKSNLNAKHLCISDTNDRNKQAKICGCSGSNLLFLHTQA